jgi:hypothetical protein
MSHLLLMIANLPNLRFRLQAELIVWDERDAQMEHFV